MTGIPEKGIDRQAALWYHTAKPRRKKSNPFQDVKRAAGGGIGARTGRVNGLSRANRTGDASVGETEYPPLSKEPV